MEKDLIVGADAGGTSVKYVVTGRGGILVQEGAVTSDPADAVATMERLGLALRDSLGPLPGRVAAVGLACAGIVDTVAGTLGRSPNLPGWEGLPLARTVSEALGGLPVVVANDVNAALVGEWRFGAGHGCRDLVMIALGTGVGGGVLVRGELVTGARHGAGEIGHMVLDLEGPPCPCGNRGCLEAYAGQVGFVRRARELAAAAGDHPALAALVARRGEALEALDLFELARAGDAPAQAIFAEAGTRLGQAVANLVNLLDPDRVIVGGGLAQAGDLIFAPARRTARRLILAEASREVPIVPAALGTHAAALGAAALAGGEG